MGLGGISIFQLLIVLAIVALIFGTKRLGSVGGDLGGAIRGFKKALNNDGLQADTPMDADAKKSEAQS
jgi:sec-independent protein translocase protein TatA